MIMANENSDTKIEIPLFDRGRNKFQPWWERFEACGFHLALKKTRENDLLRDGTVNPDATTDEGKRAKKALNRNNLEITKLTMAFTVRGLMNKVCKARTEENPAGLACFLTYDLLKEHQPKDRMSKVEVKVKLLKINM